MERKTFGQGEVIFEQGTYAETMYEIESGKVGIYLSYGSSDERHLATLGPGETFGEMGVAECYARSAMAVALEDDTRVDEVSADEFVEYFREQPDKVLTILRQMSSRLRELDERYVDACETVYLAVEAERAKKKREGSLRARLRNLIRQYRAAGDGKPASIGPEKADA